nr:MAG TPA_asm: hypothetical protein [Caudoviricetes sp.]
MQRFLPILKRILSKFLKRTLVYKASLARCFFISGMSVARILWEYVEGLIYLTDENNQ